MKPTITTRHFELNESLRQRTEERLTKLQRFFDRILDARVVVTLEKNRYSAEATVTANGTPLSSHAVAESDKVALEQALDKLEGQVRRHKDRLIKGKRRPGGSDLHIETPPESETDLAEAPEEADLDGIVGEDAGDFVLVMSVVDAAAELRTSSREALGFTNALNQRRTLVFKRRDGSVGVVDVHLV